MITRYINDAKVAVISDNNKPLETGKVTSGNILLKEENVLVIMPQDVRPWKHAAHNPLIYEGRFFSSRQKQNGNISLHGVINGETDLNDAYVQARIELDEFFTKLEALV